MQSISWKVSPLTVSISKEFHSAQNLASTHAWITELRYMGINSMHMIDFTQLVFKGSEPKAHFVPFDSLAELFINWMHCRKPEVFCSFCNINHEHLEEGSVVINSHTNNIPQICHHPLQPQYNIHRISEYTSPNLVQLNHSGTLI